MDSCKPQWWHSHGLKMDCSSQVCLRSGAVAMKIEASAADLTIRGTSRVEEGMTKRVWDIEWRIVQSYPRAHGIIGGTCFDDQGLARAFGLDDSVDPHGGESVMMKYDATTARQGAFIRKDEFLNIPCPGTGMDGDPNISILVTDEIKQAVTQLLATK